MPHEVHPIQYFLEKFFEEEGYEDNILKARIRNSRGERNF
jgi:hypothetical protein